MRVRASVLFSNFPRNLDTDVEREATMALKMRVHDKEPINAALRRFKKLLERSGMKRELRAHEHYEKPCEHRRRKLASRRKAIAKASALPSK